MVQSILLPESHPQVALFILILRVTYVRPSELLALRNKDLVPVLVDQSRNQKSSCPSRPGPDKAGRLAEGQCEGRLGHDQNTSDLPMLKSDVAGKHWTSSQRLVVRVEGARIPACGVDCKGGSTLKSRAAEPKQTKTHTDPVFRVPIHVHQQG